MSKDGASEAPVRTSLRGTLAEFLRHSLLAPAPARPMLRGLGFIAAVFACAFVGAADGAGTALGVRAIAHCAAVMSLVGVVLGLLGEAIVAAAARLVPLVRLWYWIEQGPRRWFARDVKTAHVLLLLLLGVLLLIAPVFPVAHAIVTRFRSQRLMAVAITLAYAAAVPVAISVVMLAAAPARWMLERARAFASPGVVVLGLALGLAVVGGRFAHRNAMWFADLDGGGLALAASFPVIFTVTLLALRRWRRLSPAPLSPRWVALVAAIALLAGGSSMFAVGASSPVNAAVLTRSHVTSWVELRLRGRRPQPGVRQQRNPAS